MEQQLCKEKEKTKALEFQLRQVTIERDCYARKLQSGKFVEEDGQAIDFGDSILQHAIDQFMEGVQQTVDNTDSGQQITTPQVNIPSRPMDEKEALKQKVKLLITQDTTTITFNRMFCSDCDDEDHHE